ncbi:MAG: hypothetical protein VB070_15145 [Clostridiaceae bacterium]|nr:hypothetical protein [Clostridiaceae bacterium]
MSKLIFKELFLFSSAEKKARKIEFSPGKTIITSSSTDGTDRGKSVIMKSLYHAMGADCFFEDMWDDATKTYILSFSINEVGYYIFRHNKLFKVFDANKNLLFVVISRHELADNLSKLFGFAVKLPQRAKQEDAQIERLEVTPPAYNYLLYFVDQDGQKGSQFASFKSLAEYSDYKENVLFYHFGAFDDDYYNLIQQSERIIAESKRLAKEHEMMRMVLDKVYASISDVSYSKDIEHLRADVNRTKNEYNNIAHKLSDLRQKLITLRNDKADLENNLHALGILDKENEKQITSLKDHVCPLCKNEIDDTTNVRIKRYNTSDDIILLTSDMQYNISDLDRRIIDLEYDYSSWLKKLSKYEASMNLQSSEINDVLRHKGYIDIKEKVSDDLHNVEDAISENEKADKEIRKGLKKYNDAKKKINERYYTLMLEDKNRFGLEGIDSKSFETIKRTFTAGGSNNPISTIIWYVNLLQIKREFNSNAIDFPVVFDSPNNAETDDEKRNQIYKYICERVTDNQLIVSGIGFLEATSGAHFDSVITLTNEKYELLCDEDYAKYATLLYDLNNKQLSNQRHS